MSAKVASSIQVINEYLKNVWYLVLSGEIKLPLILSISSNSNGSVVQSHLTFISEKSFKFPQIYF